jgi:histidinol phosphatase-like PHP family hydrolase
MAQSSSRGKEETMLANRGLAELMARAATDEEGHRARALRRAGRAALTWEEEAANLAEAGRSLTELRGVGPWVAGRIAEWLEDPPAVPDPPEARRGFLTLAEARATLAQHPGWRPSVLSYLQVHTTWSDGRVTLDEMVSFVRAQGHRYMAVTDHSVGLPIAHGMDEPTLLRQIDEVDRLNETLDGFRVLRSLEMNLSPVGEGDMDPAVLARLDLVLGAFHSKLRVTEDQTERYLAAVRNPTVHILAHPRGRRYGVRPGLRADWPRVMAAAVEARTAVEIDCYPDRQDLQVDLLEHARTAGTTISIGTDAHTPGELVFIDLGVAAAVRAEIPRQRILNCMDADAVLAWAAR